MADAAVSKSEELVAETKKIRRTLFEVQVAEGVEQGIQRGLERGRQEGVALGMERGRAEGAAAALRDSILTLPER